MCYKVIKRVEDIVFSLIILLIFSPILIFVSIVSILFQGWPVYYISKRMIGINNIISIIKFRTMVKDAKSDKYGLEKKYMKNGYLDIPLESEVYTPIGRILEKTQIVEIPQFFPVLFGKISFVGNRPLPIKNIELLKIKYPENKKYSYRQQVKFKDIGAVHKRIK